MKTILFLIFTIGSMIGCASSPFRSSGIQLRPSKEVKLENGMRVIFIHDDSLPRTSMQILFKVGQRHEAHDLSGLNAMTADLLEQGTINRQAMKLADEFGSLGTELNVTASSDFTILSSDVLANSSDKLLDLFSDILMNPAFNEKEIERLRAQTLAHLQKKVDNPSSYADDEFESYLFGQHPYGQDTLGRIDSVKRIAKSDIIKHYLAWYRPNNSTLAVVGQFNESFEKNVMTTFSKWPAKAIKEISVTQAIQTQNTSLRLVTKNGLKQTQIRIGRIGIQRKNEDYLQLRLANEALGGSFASRLMQHVRDDLGLTYGVHSHLDSKADPGVFEISTFTKNETAGKTLDETLKVYREFVEKGMTEKELQAAKAQLIGQFPRAIETPDRLAFNLLVLDFYGIPSTYLTDFNSKVENMKLSEVNAAIRKHFEADKIKILVFGDEKEVAKQLLNYNPEIIKAK